MSYSSPADPYASAKVHQGQKASPVRSFIHPLIPLSILSAPATTSRVHTAENKTWKSNGAKDHMHDFGFVFRSAPYWLMLLPSFAFFPQPFQVFFLGLQYR